MSATTLSRRRTKAFADKQVAKERRQKFIVAGAVLLLVIVLAFELPGIMNRGGSTPSTTAVAPVAPTISAPVAPAANPAVLRAVLKHPAHDPFALATSRPGANTLGSVPYPPGLHDPFASRSTPASATTPAVPVAPVTKVSQIQGKIIIGTPGKGRVAEKGWIVILASIPTSRGRGTATKFMSSAHGKGLSSVSLLNSSNRRPLRGGYWVVYTGPYASLAAVSNASSSVHGKGYSGAYVRELIVYKPKTK
jgi:hypothetical protein